LFFLDNHHPFQFSGQWGERLMRQAPMVSFAKAVGSCHRRKNEKPEASCPASGLECCRGNL
jgi:hypothetical protein